MIIQEPIQNTNLIRTYSNLGFMIEQQPTKILYPEAIDIQDTIYTYIETDIPIEDDEDIAKAADYEAALNKLGVDFNAET